MPSDPLADLAREFADQVSGLLNKTICNGIRVRALPIPHDRTQVVIGYGLSKSNPLTPTMIPVRISSQRPSCYLSLSYRLRLDDERRYLAVVSSVLAICTSEDESLCLCHYDYERDKPDGYPEAHLQVEGGSPALDAFNQRQSQNRTLGQLHFPVGGRRFRPTLEDVVDFLVTEGLAKARKGWQAAIAEGREQFRVKQLRAAIRRDPDAALDALRDFGHLRP